MQEPAANTVPPAVAEYFRTHPRPAVALSGGADSAYLLWCAHQCCADVQAYFVKTQFQTETEIKRAIGLALDLHVGLCLLEMDILDNPAVTANGPDRCYHCKTALLGRLLTAAEEDGRDGLADGTNASDDPRERPGMRALAELGISSPLRTGGLSKKDVRRLSKAAGLPTWDLPSDSCLATRIAVGVPLTAADLRTTERAENALRTLGLTDLRVRRDTAGAAAVQVPASQLPAAEKLLPQIRKVLAADYAGITLGTR
ncbi:MAG: ATP-dependent sacrificial sulfur transferase LarE [Candidatus Methanomethylophilus sp.]|nr:ATP-dependent sacrificial sulfur transferase LarE [Methanomethylophilus sp.]